MIALRHISLGLVALLLLLAGGAWLAPTVLEWNRYRADVSGLASAALGQKVRIEGRVTLRVLPQPLLVAERVTVDASAGATVTAEQLLLRVALMPLLAGRVEARELVLRGADIRLPWPPDPAALALRTPSWLSALSARIERGRLQIGEVAVTGLEATLATNDVSGSFLSTGRARSGGRDWAFTARVSQPGGDGAVGVDVTLDGQGAGAVISGQLQPDGTMLGRVALRGTDLSQLVPAPSVPFRVEGRLTTGDGLVAADELAGDLAGAPVKGAIALRLLPRLRLDVAVAASRLDLDAWAPALLRGAAGLPPGMPLGIDLSAEAAVLGDGTLRGLRAAFDIAEGKVEVREARALLPGEANLRLKGRIAPGAAGRHRFDGEAALDAPALRTTLSWAARAGFGPVDALPPSVLRTAALHGQVRVEDGELTIADMAGQVDGSALVAALSWRPAPRPTLRAVVTAERVDLDPWAASFLPATGAPDLIATAATFGPLALDLRLSAEAATLRGIAATDLRLDLAAAPGRIEVRQMAAQALGAAASASFTLLEGGRVADGKAELKADRATGLTPHVVQALGPNLAARLEPLLRGALLLQLQAGGAPENLGLKLAASLADLRLEATPTLDLPGGRWAGTLTLRHPGAPRLAETLGQAGASAWLGDGSLALVAQLTAGADRLVAESFDLSAGGLRAGGALRLDRGEVPRLSGRIAAEGLMLPWPYPRSPDPLPIEALLGWEAELTLTARSVSLSRERVLEDATATLALARGQLHLADLTATLARGRLTGSLTFDAAARPPTLVVQGGVRGGQISAPVFDTAIDLAAGVLDGAGRLSAAGFSPAGLLASLGGSMSLSVRDGALAGIGLARMGPRLEEADLRAALAGGRTEFDRLSLEGEVQNGGLLLRQAAVSGHAGTATATGTIDLTRALLGLRLVVVPPVTNPPEIGLRLSGPADSPERVPELAGAVRWRAEHPP
jgi:hypothetical protein